MVAAHSAFAEGSAGSCAASFSLVRDDALIRLQRRIGLVPAHGLGIVRRALFFGMLGWLPLVLIAAVHGHLLAGTAVAEPLLGHYAVHVRALVGVPLLIAAEALAHTVIPLCLSEFVRNGMVDGPLDARFRQILEAGARLRDRTYPWVVIAGVALAWTAAMSVAPHPDSIRWGDAGGASGFAVWWFLLVSRPIFNVLLLAWLWRLALLCIVMFRIARLPLRLVPSHPDRFGGLGFLARLPLAFAPFSLAVSAVVAAAWAHEVVYHGVPVSTLYVPMGTLVIVLALLVLAPLLCFTPLLMRTRKRGVLDYGVLLSEHGRKVDDRWMHGRAGLEDDPLLNAPELGPVADTHALYEAVERTRIALVNKSALVATIVPAAVPMLVLVAAQFPLGQVLAKLLVALL